MLHLITLPIMVNSLLHQCYNPILATVADNLDLKSVCHSAEALATKGNIADPEYRSFHQVSTMLDGACLPNQLASSAFKPIRMAQEICALMASGAYCIAPGDKDTH